ncbi:MAG: dicarboxylate/amino acid:cation symporter, partial [Thiohalocapsa sp.]
LRHLAGQLGALIEQRLWLKVLIGMAAGLATGVALGPAAGLVEPELGALIGNWLALPGQLFIATIQMIVVPLVFASIILGLASSENAEQLKRLGLAVVGYFIVTTAIAAAIGLWLASLLKPGRALSERAPAPPADGVPEVMTPPGIAELPQALIGLLPGNPLSAMVEGQMLQVVIFSVMVGVALVAMAPKQSRPMLELLGSLQQVCMTVVRWAMWLAPVAVFGLMARLTSQLGLQALFGMSQYVLVVLLGLAVLLVFYLAIVTILVRQSPFVFLRATRELLLLAFSTSSSAAVMPLSIKTAEEKLSIRPSIAQFVIPLGATINMNGTALYQGVATVFLAQVYGIDISFSGMVLVVALAVGASIGSPATPGVGIVILATVLATVGIPPEGVALILGVDRILDMSRTAINVAGDLVASQVMNHWIGGSEAASTNSDSPLVQESSVQSDPTAP